MKSVLSVAALAFAAVANAVSSQGARTLVVVDEDGAQKGEYKTFLGDLKERGFDLTYSSAKNDKLRLFELGERNFDHIVLLPSQLKNLGPNLTPSTLVNFVNAHGNILVALSSNTPVSSAVSSVLHELDIFLPDERQTTVVDHFNYDKEFAPETHDVLVLEAPKVKDGQKGYFSPESDELVVFPHGVGHVMGQSPLIAPLIRAPETAYSYSPKTQAESVAPEDIFAVGNQLGLVSTVQARNSARVTVVGAGEMLADKWLEAEKNGKKVWNREFAKRVSGWTFQEIGVIKVDGVEHWLNEGGAIEKNPGIYRVKNDVSYSVDISEWSWDQWVPYSVPSGDSLQLEFSMLSPFHRIPLSPVSTSETKTTYATNFTIPDQHGIFNFMLDYKRPFINYIEDKVTVSVRHMAHDEWPRSYEISGAWPWMGGIGATVVGFIAFSGLWMFSAEKATGETKKVR